VTTDTISPNHVFYVWLVVLQTICAKYGLEKWFSPNDDIRKFLLDMKYYSTKRSFWFVKKNDLNDVSLFLLCYLITHMVYPHFQCTPSVQIKNFMFDWSFYRLFVLNGCWKHDSFQIMIFEYVCSTWSIVELKTRFETWIKRNDVNGVSLFHLFYLITLNA
jgi:hypothetical protein